MASWKTPMRPVSICMERMKGIEPSYQAWEARILPLNYIRTLWYLLSIADKTAICKGGNAAFTKIRHCWCYKALFRLTKEKYSCILLAYRHFILSNKALPIIRYFISFFIILISEGCKRGAKHLRIRALLRY